MKAFFVSIPHSGERVPSEVKWLAGLSEPTLMRDVDRYVDRLYEPVLSQLKVPVIKTEWHRYVVDLNRLPEDIDEDAVIGAPHAPGKFSRGFHWSITTLKEKLMPAPMSWELHEKLVRDYYEPFHQKIRERYKEFEAYGAKAIFHLDAHSMPSVGTEQHRDPGEVRKDIVVSDSHGKSASRWFRDLVISSYKEAGFNVGYNWPYFGGRVTETYGRPDEGHHALQVEMSRALYMDENDKSLKAKLAEQVQNRLQVALQKIHAAIPEI